MKAVVVDYRNGKKVQSEIRLDHYGGIGFDGNALPHGNL